MSFEIPVAFVDQYARNVNILSQQKGSRLQNAVYRYPEPVVGSRFDVEQVGASDASLITSRHSDTPLNNVPQSRRWANMKSYGWGELIDRADRVKMLIDPTSSYTLNAIYAMGREMDKEIIAQALGPASSGHDGTTTVSFPASNVVAVNDNTYDPSVTGNTGLTVSKLIKAKELIRAANVDPNEPMYIACKEHQIANLLATTQVTSIWYNNVKALVEGAVDRFMGFTFIQTELITQDSGGYDQVIAFAKTGIAFGVGESPRIEVAPDPGKRFSTRIYVEMGIGAVRTEEAKVVSVLCDPTK